MGNPNYPEGVKEEDIDRIGQPFPLTEEHECLCDGSCIEKIGWLEEQLENKRIDLTAAKAQVASLREALTDAISSIREHGHTGHFPNVTYRPEINFERVKLWDYILKRSE